MPNGLIIEDVKIGNGDVAKSGKRVGMRYIGKLTNGKVFDKNVSGRPFNFLLGRGEVIKGWDIGVAGMKVGGERKLTIPAPLAYGKQGAPPDIPRNATLVFEVSCLYGDDDDHVLTTAVSRSSLSTSNNCIISSFL